MASTLIAEFTSPEGLIAAAARLHELGYRDLETYSPYPIPEVEQYLGLRRTRIPFFVLAAGLTGILTAFLVIWGTNAISYPLNVGGRPLSSFFANVPIMFETGILFASSTAFILTILFSGLPLLHHPIFQIEGFSRVSIDRFWILIDTGDSAFDSSVESELVRVGAIDVRRTEMTS